jgi:hypothetical protein
MGVKSVVTRPAAHARSVLLLVRAVMRSGVWWLLPLIVALVLTAFIFSLLGAAGPLDPFVYPLF